MSVQQKRKPEDGSGKGERKSKRKRLNRGQQPAERVDYKDIVKENCLFEQYYKGQKIVADEEWDAFLDTLRQSLPATFRITSCNSDGQCLKKCLEERFFAELHKIEVDGERIPLPQPLPWYPDHMAWHVSLSKKFIRKTPIVKEFHNFLVKENEQGNISRQEAVSMVPPLLLDVRPHHKVLDMCAAPGSKTAQLIEALHSADTADNAIPGGVVVANDADPRRCYMLVHQAKRLNSPCVMVTNHDASVFPQLYQAGDGPLVYDRILCDVPCSGDGTLRKNPTIWQSWSPSLSSGLHKLQLRILKRGLEVLAVGGRLVYSTCSFNPVENEAVVASTLKLCQGTVEVVDTTQQLVGLKRTTGMTTWKVMTKDGEWVDHTRGEDDTKLARPLVPSMFPLSHDDHMITRQLTNCVRILPHHQDTGGFFVTVLEKKAILPWQKQPHQRPTTHPTLPLTDPNTAADDVPPIVVTTPASPDPQVVASGDDVTPTPRGESSEIVKPPSPGDRATAGSGDLIVIKPPSSGAYNKSYKRKGCFKEDPYVFLSAFDPECAWIMRYYGFQDNFPANQMLVRSEVGKKRNLYLVSKLVRELTISNGSNIKIVNTGIRVFGRCTQSKGCCPFRFAQEAVGIMHPFMTQRLVSMAASDVGVLLQEPNPLLTGLSQLFQDSARSLESGPVVLRYTPDTVQPQNEAMTEVLQAPIHLSAWLAAQSCRLFVGRPDRFHYLTLLGLEYRDDTSLVNTGRHDNPMVEEEDEEVIDNDSNHDSTMPPPDATDNDVDNNINGSEHAIVIKNE